MKTTDTYQELINSQDSYVKSTLNRLEKAIERYNLLEKRGLVKRKGSQLYTMKGVRLEDGSPN